MNDVIALVILAVIGFILFGGRRREPPLTSQDFVGFKRLTQDGILELPGQHYRLVMEVAPINLALKSPEEQSAIWLGFRQMLDSLTLKTSCLVQTRFLDMREYLAGLKKLAEQASTAQLREYGVELAAHLTARTEEKSVRDRRYYVIIKYSQSESYEENLRTDNEMINDALARVSKKKVPDDEALELARQELENMAGVIHSSLANLGILSARLNKAGLLEMLYATFNRDMAPVVSMADADAQGMFSLAPRSLTPFLEEVAGTEEEAETAE